MHVDSTRTLLLNQGYEPIKIVSWQRAITLVALDKVEVVEEYDAQIRATSMVIQIPAVVRLRKAFRRHAKPVILGSRAPMRAAGPIICDGADLSAKDLWG